MIGVRPNGAPRLEDIEVPAGPRAFSVALHDVAFATQDACVRLAEQLDSLGPFPLTLLITPRWHRKASDPRFDRWIESRLARGDELVLHGLTHVDEAEPPRSPIDALRRRIYTDGEGEFAAIDGEESLRRMRAGLRWFNERKWPVRGFVAPAWLLGPGAWSVLQRPLFDYTCTLRRVVALGEAGNNAPLRALPAWSIAYSSRSAWRRAASRPWTAWIARRTREAPLLRIELHPGDAEHAPLREAALRRVAEARADKREPLTLGAAVDRWLGHAALPAPPVPASTSASTPTSTPTSTPAELSSPAEPPPR